MSRAAVATETADNILDLMHGGRSIKDGIVKMNTLLLKGHHVLRMSPTCDFNDASRGVAPDYSDLASWTAHPKRTAGSRLVEDANHIAPHCHELPSVESRPCDCFYVADTCFHGEGFRGKSLRQCWNLPLGSEEGSFGHKLSKTVLEQMEMRAAANASCFNRTCRVYAPVYRMIPVTAVLNMEALTTMNEYPQMKRIPLLRPQQLRSALDVAYDDVRRAFVDFVDDVGNSGRPFVLAGHSQGVMHLTRLLQEEIENHPSRRERFVHAYLAGFGVPLDLFATNLKLIRPSSSASDICSVSSWRTAALRHGNPKSQRSGTFYVGKGWRKQVGPLLANNPITWSQGPEASTSDPTAYLGALWPVPENLDLDSEKGFTTSGVALRFGRMASKTQEVLGAIVPALVKVDCGPITACVDADGLVRVPNVPRSSLFAITERDFMLYHDLDFGLFHNNIQHNVASRVESWFNMRAEYCCRR